MTYARHQRFVFSPWSLEGRALSLPYRLESPGAIELTERIVFPADLPAPDAGDPTTRAAIDVLHLLAGVSYWKASTPQEIVVSPIPDDVAALAQAVYRNGLAQFFHENQMDPAAAPAFRRGGTVPSPYHRPHGHRWLLMIGGGKDSAVSREILRDMDFDVDLLSIGAPHWIRAQAAAMGDRHLVVHRLLDPQLAQLNAAGASNGHVPVTAILAAISWVTCLAGGYAGAIASNERSASVPSTQWCGLDVNHQWSKGLEFESAFQTVLQARSRPNPLWFSLLRPLSEVAIARRFADHHRYLSATTSCNANFRQPGAHEAPPRWCGTCPKCTFVYIVAGAFLSRDARAKMFGGDLLVDAEARVRELAELDGPRPYECIGTPSELSAAIGLWRERGDWPGSLDSVADALFARHPPAEALAEALTPSPVHGLPPGFFERLTEALDTA